MIGRRRKKNYEHVDLYIRIFIRRGVQFRDRGDAEKMIGDELPVSRIARITNKGKVRNAEKTKEEKLRNKKKTGAD